MAKELVLEDLELLASEAEKVELPFDSVRNACRTLNALPLKPKLMGRLSRLQKSQTGWVSIGIFENGDMSSEVRSIDVRVNPSQTNRVSIIERFSDEGTESKMFQAVDIGTLQGLGQDDRVVKLRQTAMDDGRTQVFAPMEPNSTMVAKDISQLKTLEEELLFNTAYAKIIEPGAIEASIVKTAQLNLPIQS